jgi:hypothetical protein
MLDALFADSGRPFLRDVWVANILDIEAEARAASQERPHPDCVEAYHGELLRTGRTIMSVARVQEDVAAAEVGRRVAQERPEDIAGDLWHQEEGWHSPGVAQERPPSRGWKTPGDPSIDGTDFPSQEWPSIDVERLHRELWAEFGEMLSDDEYASIERIVARLTGGSVASPEPSDG